MTKNEAVKAGEKISVSFKPSDLQILVEPGTNLWEASIRAGARLYASCGGDGSCGTCKIKVLEGEVETTRTHKISDEDFQHGIRQACQSRLIRDLVVEILPESRLETAVVKREPRNKAIATGWRFNPPVSKYYIELTPPTLHDNVSDLSRHLLGLNREYSLDNLAVDFDVMKKLPVIARNSQWKVTVTIFKTGTISYPDRVIDVQAGDTRDRNYALALDIGTTSIKMQLLNLNKGKVLAEAADYNRQIDYGADVISRINYSQKTGGLERLQLAVVGTINGLIKRLLDGSGTDREDISYLMSGGNTTMIQLLMGLDPKYIRLAPYTPTATFLPPVRASNLGIDLGGHVYLTSAPLVASYVGGDIVSGVVAAGMHQTNKVTLYIDIGTNGEIVVGNSDWMVAAACSAGPAFEGGEIKYGMIASNGAIEDVTINPETLEPSIRVIGGEKAKGICGSGLINTVAGLLETGIIDRKGKFNPDLQTRRIRRTGDVFEYVLVWQTETQIGKDIVITSIDIENLIRAKAAMYAGYKTLLKNVGLKITDIEQIIIAGNFGNYIDIGRAITIGLLPDVPRDRFIFIGNGSLLGASLGCYSTDITEAMKKVAGLMTNIELSENAGFMDNYMAAMFLPHTDTGEFPTMTEQLAGRRAAV